MALVLTACSSQPPTTPSATDASDRVQTQEFESKPRFVSIVRTGDPKSALAVAVQHAGDSAGGAAFAKTLTERLSASGFSADSEVFERGVIVRLWFEEADADRAVAGLKAALAKQFPASRGPHPTPVRDACGRLGEPMTARQISENVGYLNMALSAVGSAEAVSTIQQALEADQEWPRGSLSEPPVPDQDLAFATKSAGGERLSVGLLSSQVSRLSAAAEAIRKPGSLFSLVAGSAPGHWSLNGALSGLLENNGCLWVELEGAAQTNSAAAARTALSLTMEMKRAVSRAAKTPLELYALGAADPRDAAGRAAWATLHRGTQAEDRSVVHFRGSAATASDFAAAAAVLTRPALKTRSRTERGQGRLWALLTRACPTSAESTATAGHTATALVAAAASDPAVEAWVADRGLGLVVSEPAFGSDAPDRLAERLARTILSFRARPIDVSVSRQKMSALLPTEAPWDLALQLGSDGHPSMLFPPGAAGAVAALSAERAVDALTSFLQGPLQLVMLNTHTEGQAAQAGSRLASLLAPMRGEPAPETCPAPPLSNRLTAGEYAISSDATSAVLIWPIAPSTLPAARWFAEFLNAFWLRKSLMEPGLVERTDAVALGGRNSRAALALNIHAQPEVLNKALLQARALVERLRSRGPTPSEYTTLETHRNSPRPSPDPRKRLLRLWHSDPPALSLKQISEFAKQQLSEERLIVVRPKTE